MIHILQARLRSTQAGVLVAALVLAAACPVGLAHADNPPATAPQTTAAPQAATASSVGLLPVHAIAVDIDALPGGSSKGGGKPDDLAAIQQLWDSFLKGAGFNVIEFEVDVHDLGDRGAGRVARLCEWAKQHDVRIAPTLMGAADGQPLPADYPNLAASFVGKVIANLGASGIAGYSQIVFYQLDRPLNQPASHGPMEAAAAGAVLKAAAENVRAAEQAGLASSGLQSTPLLVPGSFDYELIRRGAIANTAISDESYTQAYGGLKDYMLTVFGSAPVEAASIEWYPGSLSSDGVDRLPDLVNRLEADLPGKLLIIDTGYSSAASTDTAQARYYQVALSNLCDLRANQGVDSPFAGILWRSAVDGGNADAAPAGPAPAAGEVTKAWNDPKAEARQTRSWLNGIQSHFGLLARARENGAGLAPKISYRIMSGLETALAQSPQASDALAAVKELGAAGKKGGMGQVVKSRLQTAMFGMLDAWLTKTADNLFSSPSESAPAATPGLPAQPPDIAIYPIDPIPASVPLGTRVAITLTLYNGGGGSATDATVYLRDANHNDLARTNPVSLSPGGQMTLELSWTPPLPGQVQGISADAFCSNDPDQSSNHIDYGSLQVVPGKKPPRPFGVDEVKVTQGSRLLLQSLSSPTTGAPPPSTVGTGVRALVLATKSSLGFATIEGLSAPGAMIAKTSSPSTPAPTTSARKITPPSGTGAAKPALTAPATGSVMSSVTEHTSPGRDPVTITLANPFNMSFRNVVATLRVDDAIVSTRPLGTLLASQRRTVTFSEWTPPHPGTYRLRADLDGVDLMGKHLTSSATSSITIAGAEPVARMAPMPQAPVRSFAATRAFSPMMLNASSQPVRGFGGPPSGFGRSPGVRSFRSNAAINLSANSILLRPFPPREGTPVAVSVQLSNLDRAPIQGARVSVSVDGEALGEVASDVPGSGGVIARGFKDWTAKPGRHDVHAVVTVGSTHSEATKPLFVMAPGTRGFGRPGFEAGHGFGRVGGMPGGPGPGAAGPGAAGPGGKGGFAFQPGVKPAFGGTFGAAASADLQIVATDIRFMPPAPASGTALTVTINVRNVGAGAAADGRVLAVITAGGVEATRKQFTAPVPAGGMLSLQWSLTAPAGTPLVVTATATASGDQNLANNQARATAVGSVPIKTLLPKASIGVTPRKVVTP